MDSWLDLLPFTGHGDAHVGAWRWCTVASVSTLAYAALGGLVLLRPGRVTLARAVQVAVALSCAFVAEVVLLMRVPRPPLSGFGVAGLLWYVLCLGVPLLGAATLLAHRRGRDVTRAARVLALLCVASAGLCAWMHFVEPRRLVVETVRHGVPAAREGSASVRLVVLADVQNNRVGSFERTVIGMAIALEPDAVLIPGDLFQGTWPEFQSVRADFVALVRTLSAAAPTYFVPGDTDYEHDLPAFCAEAGATLLDSDTATLRVKDRVLSLAGLAPYFRGAPDVDPEARRRFLKEFEAAPGDADVRILLAHHGQYARELARRSRVDLVVAGHTHGGQVALPFLGPPVTASPLPRRIAWGGLFEDFEGRTALYQSRGLGMERLTPPEIRLCCPPTIGLVVIEDRAPMR